jgi:hypothetical protein
MLWPCFMLTVFPLFRVCSADDNTTIAEFLGCSLLTFSCAVSDSYRGIWSITTYIIIIIIIIIITIIIITIIIVIITIIIIIIIITIIIITIIIIIIIVIIIILTPPLPLR